MDYTELNLTIIEKTKEGSLPWKRQRDGDGNVYYNLWIQDFGEFKVEKKKKTTQVTLWSSVLDCRVFEYETPGLIEFLEDEWEKTIHGVLKTAVETLRASAIQPRHPQPIPLPIHG